MPRVKVNLRERQLPKTIVPGGLADVDDRVHNTPRNDPPKPLAETGSGRNTGVSFSACRSAGLDGLHLSEILGSPSAE
ncbi:hypothetical protein [Microbacterium hydrocarbonoxydans]|uniref:hypothetical protein n=1 Tax=Microbacterium hydrocarbonoxydans TaxID=273678 RepID=UPI00203E6D57|nr:hypothetical protein [Microbacterium hydrocarbonoxydans]MCM3781282.1 hypothetical protein [Microbacterium hydrocarbonoxydans]